MSYKPLLAGNVGAIAATIAAFLQLLSWPIAGLLVLALLATPILLTIRPPGVGTKSSSDESFQERHRKQSTKNLVQVQSLTSAVQPEPQHVDDQTRSPPVSLSSPQQDPPTKPAETPETLRPGECLTFDLELESGNRVEGKVSADGYVNAYILTEDNLTSLDLDQEFWYEEGSEDVEEVTLHFTAPEDGSWVLVVENSDSKDVSVTVKIRVTRDPSGRKPIRGTLTESVPGFMPAEGKLESL